MLRRLVTIAGGLREWVTIQLSNGSLFILFVGACVRGRLGIATIDREIKRKAHNEEGKYAGKLYQKCGSRVVLLEEHKIL